MKKILLTLFATFLLGSLVNAQTTNCPAGPRFYPDVPTGHWASTAVSRLSDLGIIIGFPDGLYRGNENLTRYQAALMFFRLIECYFPIIPQSSLGQADIDALQRAIAELTGSLAAVEASTRANASGVASNSSGISRNAASIAAIETTVSALSSGVSSNSQRLDTLHALVTGISIPNIPAPVGGIPDEVLQRFQNQLDALQVKSDTAMATAQKAEALATKEVDLTAFEARIKQNKRSINDINKWAEVLNADVVGLHERVEILEGHKHAPVEVPHKVQEIDLSGVYSDLANMREFSVLLRKRQIDLEGRVSALESVGTGDIDALARRVDIIEGKLFEFSGSLKLFYNVRRHSIFDRDASGNPIRDPASGAYRYDHFDVDRIFGEGFLRELPVTAGHSFVSTGVDDDDDEDDFERITDFNGPREGRVNADIEIAFGFASGNSGCGFPRKLDCFSGIIELELAQLDGGTGPGQVQTDDGDTEFIYAFNFTDAELHYSPIGGNEHLKFEFGRNLDIDFTGYVVDTGDSDEDDEDTDDNYFDLSSGFAAHFDASDYLGGLSPSLTFFYGTNPGIEGALPARYAWGARAGISFLDDKVALAASFATVAENAGDYNDELEDNVGVTVFGVDGRANIGIFDLEAEFASETLDTPTGTPLTFANGEDNHSLFFAILGIDTKAVKLGNKIKLKALEVNYRNIPVDWFGINGGSDAVDDPEGGVSYLLR